MSYLKFAKLNSHLTELLHLFAPAQRLRKLDEVTLYEFVEWANQMALSEHQGEVAILQKIILKLARYPLE